MTIYLAGIAHEDPMGRTSLIEWLREIESSEGCPPAFVAVEYSEAIFKRIKAQRSTYREMVEKILPNANLAEREIIIATFAYDGDTHLEVFPDVDTVYLDAHRYECEREPMIIDCDDPVSMGAYPSKAIDRIAELRAEALEKVVNGGIIGAMSYSAWYGDHVWDPWRLNSEIVLRNKLWTNILVAEKKKRQGAWAVVVAGAAHLHGYAESLGNLLDDCGVDVKGKILDPNIGKYSRTEFATINEDLEQEDA